ncbi:MAG: Nucleotidyl transferase, bifunctional UDP-N-acetylglucosamine pyrophosphorylase / Glucosamine-1-phosphate N-acetyltransferase [Candidatus Peregrinibacteria bacterium GW2011_GWF2_43_17]|nr:MAG: Nucleotidyl transferase, bifunctional UDP-N-acetylglucosamine pyrophosphorylase / Glucosamine-1-phosphate N-acetyltransferase [Candidatus Peregrinibacteria bacterium GW2011_GWF2_43_17]KKT20659.1 MAG: Nucleotidyl transferase [Candidatus Peregrinibacteria bacterium GW2011_GWA2_43_8]HAU39348.1 hypothetical protein [Candidatus Peregrinibacteria bacterium]
MRAIILAAGRSKRMKPIEDKNFLKFLGKTLLECQVDIVKKAGFKNITIIAGEHNIAKIKKTFPKLEVIKQKNLDEGMAGAMDSLHPYLKDEAILILSANDFLDESAFNLMKKASEKSPAEILMLAKKVKSYFPGGYLEVANKNRITDIIEKPGEGKEPSDMINIVLHIHKNPKKLIETIKKIKTAKDDKYEMAIAKLIKEDTHAEAVPYTGLWQALKYPWHILELQKYFLSTIRKSKISKTAKISKSAQIKGSVIIEDNVKIFDHATVVGPIYIGKNSIIANNSLVRESMIGDSCVIGFNSEVARSNLADHVWLHTNYIGDSIVSENTALGAGSVTGNLRLDEGEIRMDIQGEKTGSNSNKFGSVIGKDCRIGINVSIMPGVKIGENAFITGGLIINQDIPDNSFVKGKVTLEIKENKLDGSKLKRSL